MCGKWHEDRRSEPPFSGPNFSRKSGLLPACETALSASNRLGALPPSNPPLPSQRLSWPLQHPSPVTGPIAAVLTCRKPLSSAMQTHSLTALEIALGASQIEKAIGLPSMPLNALGRGSPLQRSRLSVPPLDHPLGRSDAQRTSRHRELPIIPFTLLNLQKRLRLPDNTLFSHAT